MARISNQRPRLGASGARLYFTDFNVSMPAVNVSTWGDIQSSLISLQPEITFSGVMTHTEGSHAIMMALLHGGGIDFAQERREWRCVWCASPNPIEHRHCESCGGPRGWIL